MAHFQARAIAFLFTQVVEVGLTRCTAEVPDTWLRLASIQELKK
jgi:hypothetical protein